jgi:hypothetical protein
MSLDLDYLDKVKTSDLKNILREKLNGYLANHDLGNPGARREALGILPPPPPVVLTVAAKKPF